MLQTEEVAGGHTDRRCSKGKPNDRRKNAIPNSHSPEKSTPLTANLSKTHQSEADHDEKSDGDALAERAGRLSPIAFEGLLKELTDYDKKASCPLALQLLSHHQSQDELNSVASSSVYTHNHNTNIKNNNINSISRGSTANQKIQRSHPSLPPSSFLSMRRSEDDNNNRESFHQILSAPLTPATNGTTMNRKELPPTNGSVRSGGGTSEMNINNNNNEDAFENGFMRSTPSSISARSSKSFSDTRSQSRNTERSSTHPDDDSILSNTSSDLRNGILFANDSRSSGRQSKKKDMGVKKSYDASSIQGHMGDKPLNELVQMFEETPDNNKGNRGRTKNKTSANSTSASSPPSEEESPTSSTASPERNRPLSPQSERGGSPATRPHRVENAWLSDPDPDTWETVETRKTKKQKKPSHVPHVNHPGPFPRHERREPKDRHFASMPPKSNFAPTSPPLAKKIHSSPVRRIANNADEDFPPIDSKSAQTILRQEAKPMQMSMSDVLKGKKSSTQEGQREKPHAVNMLNACPILPDANDDLQEEEDGFYFGLDLQTIRSIQATSRKQCVTSKRDEEALKARFNYGQCVQLLSDHWSVLNGGTLSTK